MPFYTVYTFYAFCTPSTFHTFTEIYAFDVCTVHAFYTGHAFYTFYAVYTARVRIAGESRTSPGHEGRSVALRGPLRATRAANCIISWEESESGRENARIPRESAGRSRGRPKRRLQGSVPDNSGSKLHLSSRGA